MNFGMHKSKGKLHYDYGNAGLKLIVDVDPGITSFYRSLIPKYITLNPQRHNPHISVVRHEHSINMEYWGKYEGEQVEFEYSNYIHNGTVYWWLNAFSARLEAIRVELGLYVHDKYTKPPDGYLKCFHITLANSKILGQNSH
jgi:hypothetical protein